jgi:outer membrane lipoprotein-sorting protein
MKPRARSNAKKLTLWIDQASWLPVKYQILEHNDSVSTFTMTEMKRNVSIGADAFKVSWPGSTKVITERGCS